jgi:hypothetical protein
MISSTTTSRSLHGVFGELRFLWIEFLAQISNSLIINQQAWMTEQF